jgi:hypothetical protein
MFLIFTTGAGDGSTLMLMRWWISITQIDIVEQRLNIFYDGTQLNVLRTSVLLWA